MAATFRTRILAADQTIFDREVESLLVRGRDGYFGILAHHAPLIASVVPGKLTVRYADDRVQHLCMGGGLLEIANNLVTILADAAEDPTQIDYERACRAEERARERLRFQGEGIDLDRALSAFLRAINRRRISEEFGHGGRQNPET
jgi:F-type H+-transporting ATPase subunit epsilon